MGVCNSNMPFEGAQRKSRAEGVLKLIDDPAESSAEMRIMNLASPRPIFMSSKVLVDKTRGAWW